MDDISGAEAVRIHHHEIYKKKITQSYILQLETENGIVTGHEECAKILTNNIANILEDNFPLDQESQENLLDEVEFVFAEKDNNDLLKLPDKDEVKSVLQKSNLLITWH